MTLKELVQQYKRQTQQNNTQIAEKLGVTKATVSRWLSGDVKHVQTETMERMRDVFGYDVKAVLEGKVIEFKKPILGYVKAGYDMFADENYLGMESVTEDENRLGDYFLKVQGDSMIGAGIMDGSLAYVQQCSDVPNGTIGVVVIGDEVTVKRVIKKHDMLVLEDANPAVENRYFTSKDIRNIPVNIIGKVIFVKTTF